MTIDVQKNKEGKIISYRLRTCVGRDENYKQVWRTLTIERPEGLTPARERKEVERIADEWERDQKAEYERTRSRIGKDKITLANFIKDHWWVDHVQDGTHTPSSIAFFGYMSDDIISYFGERKKLRQIDAEAVKRYIRYLNTEAKTKQGEPYSATTIQHHFATLRNILEYACRFHYIDKDPCQELSVKEKPHRDAKKVDFLDPAQTRRFIACLGKEPIFWQALVNVLITCGLRRGECVGLQWQDLDPDKLTIRVERNVTIDKDSPEKYRVGATKTGESRTVPISRRVYDLLTRLKAEREKQLKSTFLPSAFIFSRTGEPYRPIYPTEPTRYLRRFTVKYGLPGVSPHDLRHTAATLALESGANLKEVQELLGHADPSTTMAFYTGVTEEAKRRTVEGIESIISGT